MNRIFGRKLYGIRDLPKWSLASCRQFHSNYWTSKMVRQTFIDFFKQRDHRFVPSSSVVPKKNDGSYFVNAGMNQFKPLLLGTVDLQSEMASYRRVVNSQKCIRVGGKHNDLDDVGRDTYHHTFFEMLGNWSFNDYFKKDACSMAWNLLTEVYGLPKSQLYVTYFGGCKELGLEPDLECRNFWLEIGVPSEKILPFGLKDNFWVMGNTGPCGPCTEIHFDHLGRSDASRFVNAGSQEVIELWNLVFMQFDRQADGSLLRLPTNHVDTGMGLERITAVLQGRISNYDSDIFTPLFDAIKKGCNCPAYSGSVGPGDKILLDTAYRIVADHTRMSSVTIADGLLPGRHESGGKLRHIMHRCIHQASQVLGSPPGFLGDLSSVVVDLLGDTYPELKKNRDLIKDVTNQSERHYLENLVVGRQMIAKLLGRCGDIKKISGEQLLDIQDGRFGKPVPADVVNILAGEFGLTADMEKFEEILLQMQESSAASALPLDDSSLLLDRYDVDHLKKNDICVTDDRFKYDRIWTNEAYDFKPIAAKVVALKFDGKFVDRVDQGSRCGILLDRTNFYAEAGGQVADQGVVITHERDEALVSDAQSRQGYVLHMATVESGSLSVGDEVQVHINQSRRQGCMSNHTATHLLNFCLNKVLGNVQQQSSLVTDEKLSYEFTCSKMSVSNEDLTMVSELANQFIQHGSSVFCSVVPLNTAKNIGHLVTLQDEVYPALVNVISIGTPVADLLQKKTENSEHPNSVELCCGTHVSDLSHLQGVVITHLQGSNQAIKRLIAVTGAKAAEALSNAKALDSELEHIKNAKSSTEALTISQNFSKSLFDGRLLPKVDREVFQKQLEQLMQLRQVNQAKNEGTLASLTETVEELVHQGNSTQSAIFSAVDFSKTREIVQVLVRLAPNHPAVLVSTSSAFNDTVVGVVYIPKQGQTSFTSVQLAEHLCQTLQGFHSLPKGKLAKHTNIEVFSIPGKGDQIQEMNRVLNLAQKFVLDSQQQNIQMEATVKTTSEAKN